MKPEEAEAIINAYGGVIASMPKGDIVQEIMDLPFSPGRIRYAYFVYTEELIKLSIFTDETKQNLESTYAMLDGRFVEEAQKINKAFRAAKTSQKARDYLESQGGLSALMPSVEKMTEYHNFVAECYGNWGR